VGYSIVNLLDFLQTVFLHDLHLWDSSGTDENAVRVIAREYPRSRQQALLTELDALLGGNAPEADLLEIAVRARVDHLLDVQNVREWFVMMRDQVRIVIAAS
jgi:hypothetical protein